MEDRNDPILQIVDSENPPLRIFFGANTLAVAEADYESRLKTWREWEPVSIAAFGTPLIGTARP